MAIRTRIACAVLVATAVVAAGTSLSGSAATAEPANAATAPVRPADSRPGQRSFERFLETYEAANEAFINGDPLLWLAIVSDREPASIFGGFGGLGNVGVTDVVERYHLAAGAFQDSGADLQVEYLVKDVHGRLAYTVALERAQVQYMGRTEPSDQFLRVTMIFRYERGDWKIVHRHADTMIDLELPS